MLKIRLSMLFVLLVLTINAAFTTNAFAGAKGYVLMNVNTSYQANANGFVLVRVTATPEQRRVVAEGIVDGEIVASGSAADNYLDQVISSSTQTFTFRVLKGSKWEVDSDEATSVEVRWVK